MKDHKIADRLSDAVSIAALVGTTSLAIARVAGAITVANVSDMLRGRGRERT